MKTQRCPSEGISFSISNSRGIQNNSSFRSPTGSCWLQTMVSLLEVHYTLPSLNITKPSNESALAQSLVNLTGIDIAAITSNSIELDVSLSFSDNIRNLLDGPLPTVSVDVNINGSSINLVTVKLREGLEINQVSFSLSDTASFSLLISPILDRRGHDRCWHP